MDDLNKLRKQKRSERWLMRRNVVEHSMLVHIAISEQTYACEKKIKNLFLGYFKTISRTPSFFFVDDYTFVGKPTVSNIERHLAKICYASNSLRLHSAFV